MTCYKDLSVWICLFLAFDWLEETEFRQQNISNSGLFTNDHLQKSASSLSTSSSSSSVSLEDSSSVGETAPIGTEEVHSEDEDNDNETNISADETVASPMFIKQSQNAIQHRRLETKALLMHVNSTDRENIILPGGCHLKENEYKDLLTFRKMNHIVSW